MPTNPTIETLIGDVVGSHGPRYGLTDSAGNTMDTVRIIANPQGGYLGVYHTGNTVNLASSTDLLNRVKGDFGSWRLYLRNGHTGHSRISAGGHPRWKHRVRESHHHSHHLPGGRPAIVATLIVPSEGAAPGEAGQQVYYRET